MALEQSWPGTTMVAGMFVLVISFWSVGERTLIGHGNLLRWFALFAFAGNLMPYGTSGLRLGMERLEWFLFNLLAVGPILLSAGLWVNYTFHGPERQYIITIAERRMSVKRHWIEHGEIPGRPVRGRSNAPVQVENALSISVAEGFLGYPVVTH